MAGRGAHPPFPPKRPAIRLGTQDPRGKDEANGQDTKNGWTYQTVQKIPVVVDDDDCGYHLVGGVVAAVVVLVKSGVVLQLLLRPGQRPQLLVRGRGRRSVAKDAAQGAEEVVLS